MMVNGDFDLARFRMDPADPRYRNVGKPKKWQRHYVQFPWRWVERLQAAKRISTYRLALLLVYEHWRTRGRPMVLSNVVLEREGVSRRSKWRALVELENLGLVEVRRRRRQSPRLVLRHLDQGQS